MKYKLNIKTLNGPVLHYTVKEYEIIEGGFIEFFDLKTGKVKRFHSSNVEIEEVEE